MKKQDGWVEFYSMMNFEIEKQAVDNARRCQRNWDHSKSIPEEHIDHWIYRQHMLHQSKTKVSLICMF